MKQVPGEQTRGIALLCDAQGTVVQVLRDELGVSDRVFPGQPLTCLVDRSSFGKLLGFLAEVRDRTAAFDWELNVPVADQIAALHFMGVDSGNSLLIVGATASQYALSLYGELSRINNEHLNALGVVVKEQADLARIRAQPDNALYDEISRLNNELVATQRELVRKNSELERLNQEKNQLLGITAHDLRSPLAAILMYSLSLLDEVSDVLNAEQLEILSLIRSSSEFMMELVDDLLDVAKIESGQLKMDLQPTDLVTLVRHSVALNQVVATRKQIELRLHDEELPLIAVDPSRIEQVLANLISNACKFSQPGTKVEVRLARAGDRIMLSVRDEGQGIPADELGKLFTPFQKTSVKGTAGEKSTGLGLAIVRKIVTGHGGQIWVESEVGKGSTFYVSLPLSLPEGTSE